MDTPNDDGLVSNHLIHWTGKNGDNEGARALLSIVNSCRLLLNRNVHYWISDDLGVKGIRLRPLMVCFTDVPSSYTEKHCMNYGKFGIALDKTYMINAKAHPVSYIPNRDNVDLILKSLPYLQVVLNKNLFYAIMRHFSYIQHFETPEEDQDIEYYREREWRITHLANAEYHIKQLCGSIVKYDGNHYFEFDSYAVRRIIIPHDWLHITKQIEIEDLRKKVISWEEYVNGSDN